MTNSKLPLLYEVRTDALKKIAGTEQTERVFHMIRYMKMLNRTANKEGFLAVGVMAEIIEMKMPDDFMFKGKIMLAADYFISAYNTDDLIELLTSRYWANNYRGEDSLMYYMLILTLVKIHNRISDEVLEDFLKSCLSDETVGKYEKYKVHFDENEAHRLYKEYWSGRNAF